MALTKILSLEIPGKVNPALTLDTIKTSFTKMETLNSPVPHKIKVLMMLSKLTHPMFNHIMLAATANKKLNNIKMEKLHWLVRISWEQKESKKAPSQAAKILAVKPAPKEQTFQE